VANLVDKVAVVIGAARGIGAATARLFAAQGVNVVIDLLDSEGQSVAEEIARKGSEALFVAAHVRNEAAVAEAIDTAYQTFGRIHVLVNVAGVNRKDTVTSLSAEDWDLVMEIKSRVCSLQ